MKKVLLAMFICLAAGVILFQGVAAAQPATPADIPAGTIITSEGYENYLNYKDAAFNPKATIYGTTIEATVLPIYGLSGPGTPDDQYTEPSAAVYYVYQIFNEGNETDTYSLSTSSATYNGVYGDDWTFEIIRDDNNNGDWEDDTDTVTDEVTLTEDGSAYFFLKVTPSSNAQDASWGEVTVTATTSATPAGEYTGANANTYGGPSYVQDTARTNINAPIMVMTRVATVDAPISGSPGYYLGGSHDPVPGAVITYTITYTNEGNADASSVIIKEKIPVFGTTEAGHVNLTARMGSGDIDNVSISAPQSTATTTEGYWFVYYSTFESPSPTGYDGSGASHGNWVLLGSIDSNITDFWYADSSPALPRTTTRWIKWEVATVEAEDSATLTWGVIIR